MMMMMLMMMMMTSVVFLKVAETMVNPFGDDDDDLELNTMLDRNIALGLLIVDEMHAEHPELIKDDYWDLVGIRDIRRGVSKGVEGGRRTLAPETAAHIA
jgi:hypothetical protein